MLLEISKPVTEVTGCFLLSDFSQLIVPTAPAQTSWVSHLPLIASSAKAVDMSGISSHQSTASSYRVPATRPHTERKYLGLV